MQRTVVLNVVGLSSSLVGPNTPKIAGFAQRGTAASVLPAFPAVTCTAQSNYETAAAELDAATERLGVDSQKGYYEEFKKLPGSFADHTVEKLGMAVKLD